MWLGFWRQIQTKCCGCTDETIRFSCKNWGRMCGGNDMWADSRRINRISTEGLTRLREERGQRMAVWNCGYLENGEKRRDVGSQVEVYHGQLHIWVRKLREKSRLQDFVKTEQYHWSPVPWGQFWNPLSALLPFWGSIIKFRRMAFTYCYIGEQNGLHTVRYSAHGTSWGENAAKHKVDDWWCIISEANVEPWHAHPLPLTPTTPLPIQMSHPSKQALPQ